VSLDEKARKMISYASWMLKRNQTYDELAPGAVHEDDPRVGKGIS